MSYVIGVNGNYHAISQYLYLILGDLLRHEVMSGSKRGLQLYKLMELGELVPAEIVLDILAEVHRYIDR